MAQTATAPTLDLVAGAAALDRDIPRVLALVGATSLDDLAWSRPSKLTLLVPLQARSAQGRREDFMLRLGFEAYPAWPPSAQFVNPSTKIFSPPQDRCFIPKLTSQECYTHAIYQPKGIQLICCSATREFYEVAHSVEDRHIWDKRNTFYTTIIAIERAMAESYQGRFDVDGR